MFQPWFGESILGWRQCMIRGAFSEPGNMPLGGFIVRPALGGNVGQFTLFVRPECRQHGVGRQLMLWLYRLALSNNAQHLVMSELIHQDERENAFFRSMGMTPDMELGTYELDVAKQVQPLCEPIARRFLRTHPHLRGVQITILDQVDPHAVGEFLTNFHSGFVEEQTQRVRTGFFDGKISTVARRADGTMTGVGLFVAKPNDPQFLLDLVLTDPAIRNGPTPLVLFAESCRQSLAQGKTTVVFEADKAKDTFAVGFAERCGVKSPRWFRYRYAIHREGMEQQTQAVQKKI
jgi:hypothetical protein